jgi:cation transporter-like permease
MTILKKHLQKLRKVKKEKYHHLIHKIHKKYNISKKTLFYVKEYGEHSNIPKKIIKESIKVLLFASILSSLGGLTLESIKDVFIAVIPLIVLLPALNDMIGDYGIIISSRFSTLLYTGKIRGKWYKDSDLQKLLLQVLIIALFYALVSSALALVISSFSDFAINFSVIYKIFLIAIIDVLLLVGILFFIAIKAGLRIYKKGEDMDNFLIPITTSIADFGNMIILAVLVLLFF